ncbi:hypothetical protein HanXRQr2_Chr10g0423861 [Helianthus annuus]|uniref:Uncharacterized protein n=1 Tax=Helianthus annuus TaxID=4232 RepID=A0A9K3HUN3_HELAN|nr:hypothetical protein HanXRQr2_Chr10g0423861 [Helianthus annuus]
MSSTSVPPDIPPDLGLDSGLIGAVGSVLHSIGSVVSQVGLNDGRMDSSEGNGLGDGIAEPQVVSKVSRGFKTSESGIAFSVTLSNEDLMFLKDMLGDNWLFRMFNEKLGIGDSDLKVIFKSESDLGGFGVNFEVLLCVEGAGLVGADFEQLSGLYGSVREILAGIVQNCCSKLGLEVEVDMRDTLKFPQLDVNVNGFDLNNNGALVFMNKRKKRSIKNEGTQVKSSRVLQGNGSCIKLAVKGSEEVCKEVLPDGAAVGEMTMELSKSGKAGGVKEKIKKNGKGNESSVQDQQFRFATSVLELKYSPGSSDGKMKIEVPAFSGVKEGSREEIGVASQKPVKSSKRVSMKKLIQEKSAEVLPYRIVKSDLPWRGGKGC